MGILLCRKKKKNEQKIDRLNQLIFVKEDVDVFGIKRKLKEMKNDIRSIKIVKCTSNRDRFESVDILLLREDLQISDFPRLQSVTIDFIRQKGNAEDNIDKVIKSNNMMANSKVAKLSSIPGLKMVKSYFEQKKFKQGEQSIAENSVIQPQLQGDEQSNIMEQFSFEKLDDKLYEKALNTIQKDVKIHLLLRYTVNPEQIVINQMSFKDKRAFLYVMRKMKQLNCTLRRIVFKDIITLKKNIFLTICQQMREIQNLEEIQIINTNIMSQQVEQLQHLLCWMQKQIKVLVISGANLIDEHIDILFFQKFRVHDFYNLNKLELKNCPQLWKSDKYIQLMKQYSQIKYQSNYSSNLKSFRNSTHRYAIQSNNENRENNNGTPNQTIKGTLAITNGGQETKPPLKQDSVVSINRLLQNRKDTFDGRYFKDNEIIIQDQNKIIESNDVIINVNSKQKTFNSSFLPVIQNNDVFGNYQLQQQNTLSRASSQEMKEANNPLNTLTLQKRQSSKDKEQVEGQQKLQPINEEQGKTYKDDITESDQRLRLLQEDQKYDNRHERHFLIGQFLWESQQQQNIYDNDQETMTQNKISENLISLSFNNPNMSNITDKGMSQQDNQFFSQFFKSCIRELMDIDMCKIIDFSGFSYQNFSVEQKKQICQYIVSSNTIQVFVIQYDRLFFKELCEQISAKYKVKRLELFESYKKELLKILKQNNNEEFNHLIQNPNIFFNNNFKNNLFSLENIKIIASKFDQFQFDSFCYFSFLSLFVLSIEIDFQKQQIEDQIVFPTHQQVLEYLRRMVTVKISTDSEGQTDDEEEESDVKETVLSGEQNNEKQDQEDEIVSNNKNNQQELLDQDQIKQSNLKNSQPQSYIKRSLEKSQKAQQHFSQSSQIFEAIRNYQQVFDLSTSLQDLSFKNFSWQNAQSSNKDKSFSQFLFTFFSLTVESIMNLDFNNGYLSHTCLNRLQEIIRKVFSKYKQYKGMEYSDTTSSCLNYQEAQEINKILSNNNSSQQVRTSFRNSGTLNNHRIQDIKELNFIQTQRSLLNKSQRGTIINKQMTQQNPQEGGTIIDLKRNQFNRSSLGQGTVIPRNSQLHFEKSILEMNRNKTKSKYFLNKFRIKFAENKMLNIKQVLSSFGRICKYVEIINATCLSYQEFQEMQILQQQQQSYMEQNTQSNKLQQSMMLAYQQGAIENPNSLLKRAKLALNNLGQSSLLGQVNQQHLFNSSSLGFIVSKENENAKRSLMMIKQNKEGFSSENKEKNVMNSIKLVDYIGFSFSNIVEINNQIEDLGELILIRCGISLYMLKQMMQKINRFKNLKKLVISGNNFNQIIQNNMNSQMKQLYYKQQSEFGKSSIGVNEQKNENPVINVKKRYSFLPQNPIFVQQKSLKNMGQSIFLGTGYLNEINPNLVQSTIHEVPEEIDIQKQNEETFKYCIEKILQIQSLKHLDLSNNEIDESLGKIMIDELVARTLKLLEYQQQQQQIKRNSIKNEPQAITDHVNEQKYVSKPSISSFKGNPPFPQITNEKKSGFFSKFIEKQLNSNISQRHQVGGNQKLSKLRHLNTKFFAENNEEEEQQSEEKDNQQSNESNHELQNEEEPSQNIFQFKNHKNDSDEEEEQNKVNKGNYLDLKNKYSENRLKTVNESDYEENNEDQLKKQFTEDRILDIELRNLEQLSSNPSENKLQQDDEMKFPQIFNGPTISADKPPPLITHQQQKPKQKINKMLENIPENDLERVDSRNITVTPNKAKIDFGGYVNELQSKHKPSAFKVNSEGKGGITTRIARLKKEDIETPEIVELYLQNNNFKNKTIRDMVKLIGILFYRIKILDLSSKQQISKKQKQPQKQQQQQQFQNKKNKFHLNSINIRNQNESEKQSSKSEQESSSQNTEQTDQTNTFQDSLYSSTSIQNKEFRFEEERAIQRKQQFEKVLSYPSLTEYQELERVSLKDINFEIFQSCNFIQNIFFYENLQDVDLSGCIDDDNIAELLVLSANNFMTCPLKKINLSRNRHLKRDSWRNLIFCFLSKFGTLEILNMSDCALNEERIQGVLDAFADLERESSLLELILSKNIRLEGVLRQFIFVLAQLHQLRLQVLDLSGCNLNDQSCENMIQGLLYGKKKRLQNINNYIMNQDGKEQPQKKVSAWNAAQTDFREIKKELEQPTIHQEFQSKSYQQSFSLIKLLLYDNNISMKMNFLIQYSFVFQISEDDNILFSMQFSCNNEQKKQLNKIWGELKDKKGLVYSNLHHHLLEEYSVSSQTLVLGSHLFSSKKITDDIILNCLRTFNTIKKLKLHVNERVVSIMNCITNSGKSQMLDNNNNLENLSASVTSNKQHFKGMYAQTTISSQELKTKNPQVQDASRNQTIISSAASNPSSKGHIIVLRDKKGGARKFTFIPKSRIDHRPVTCVPEKKENNYIIERQTTLPVQSAINHKDKKNVLEVDSYNNHIRKNSNGSSNLKSKDSSPLVTNQFGMKNRLQELQNHIILSKGKNVVGIQRKQNHSEKDGKILVSNKKRSFSEQKQIILGQKVDQKQQRKVQKNVNRERTYSQEPIPASIFKKMNQEQNNQSHDQMSLHDTQQTPNSKNDLSFHKFIRATPVGGQQSEQSHPQSEQHLSVKKDATSQFNEQNSFTHQQKQEDIHKNQDKEVMQSYLTYEHKSEIQNPSNFEMNSPIKRFTNCSQDQMTEGFSVETEINQEKDQIQIPELMNFNKLTDINMNMDYLQFPYPEPAQKKKSIIKYNGSFLDNLKGQEEKRLSFNPMFDQNPQPLSNKSSILVNKQTSQKKKITILEEPQIGNQPLKLQENSNNIDENQPPIIQKTKSIIKNLNEPKQSKNIDDLFNQDFNDQNQFGDIKKHSSFNLGELNEQQLKQLNQKINNAKQDNVIIHLQNIENLVLQSDEKIGIISLLEFFSLVSNNLKSIDFTNTLMSHSMFIRASFKALELFDNIIEMRFANLQLQKGTAHLFGQTAQAIHNLITSPSLEKLSFINSFLTEELIEAIIQPFEEIVESTFFVRELDLSKNKNISFKKEENLVILENVEVLNLSDCNLNEFKFNINIRSWKQQYLKNLIDLDLSNNKGLSPKFFCHLGEYISQRKILQRLNISYTAMYEEKQRQFSYGLNYKNGISRLALSQILVREMKFSKKEGTLMFFKALSELPCLEILDMSEMQISNYMELDILHNYLRYDYIGKFTRVKKMYFQNCTFLFDTIPYYNFESKYSLLEYNHCSLFLLTQFDRITHLDLSGCLSQKKTTKKFLLELDIMRRKKLLNYSIVSLNISKNLISAQSIRVCLCNILFLFKNLQTLQMRSLVRYELNYVYNILDALDSYQYFSFFQNQNYQNKNDGELQGEDLAEAFLKINSKTHPQVQEKMNLLEKSPGNLSSDRNSLLYKDSQISRNPSSNNSQIIQQQAKQQEITALNLRELVISDISNELINNKENIDLLLDICVANKNFQNLKKIFVNLEYSNTTNTVRLQNIYSESLLEINEKYDMNTVSADLNTSFQIRFKFKEINQQIILKPEMKQTTVNKKMKEVKEEKVLKKSIYFNNQQSQAVETKEKPTRNQTQILQSVGGQLINTSGTSQCLPITQSKKLISFSFTKMRVEYIDGSIEEDENKQSTQRFTPVDESSLKNVNSEIKHSHFNVDQQNEHQFHSFSPESDEHQIQLWRQFQPFLKKLNHPKPHINTHISLNYLDPNLKLLSNFYNIFIDNKYELNTNMNILFNNVDSLYLGNMLYYFFVQVCSFKPQNDIIDFLINYLLFISQNKFQEMVTKSIRLPPFLILSEEDASRIQSAFMNVQSLTVDQKKIQGMLVSLFKQKDKITPSQFNNSPTKRITMVSKQSIREDGALSIQRNRIATQVKTFIDKKRVEYSSASPFQSKPTIDNRKQNSVIQQKNKDQNKIVCNYFYKSKKGCEEYQEITKLKKMPPSTLNIDNFSINGLKAVYMICYHNDYFLKSDIDFESIMFVSTSLAFSLREYFYKNYTSSKRSQFKAQFNKIMYVFMDIFVDIDSYFKYDESIQALDSNLETSNKSGKFFLFMIISFYIIIYILTPIFSFLNVGPYDVDGLSYIIHATFIFYAIISVIFEIFYLRKVLSLTRHLIPDINLVHQNNVIARIKDYIYEKIMNIEIFSYKYFLFYQLIIFSFLSQLDAYQDVCFVLVTYNKEDYFISLFATFVIVLNKSIDFIFFIKMTEKTSYSNLFFQNINKIYEYSQQAYLDGLSNILDVISPHNVIRITDNFFTKTFLPKKAIGLTINKQIFHRIRKVIGCDLPQIILQLLFTLRNLSKSSSTVQLSIALNVITLIKSMYVLLTIKQSVLNQMDFDELSEQKAEFLQNQFLQYQQKEIEMFEKINNNVQLLGAKNSGILESKNISFDSNILKNEQEKSPDSQNIPNPQIQQQQINI